MMSYELKNVNSSFQAFAVLCISSIFFFCVVPRRLDIKSRRFGDLCRYHLHRTYEWRLVVSVVVYILRSPKRRLLISKRRGTTQKKKILDNSEVCINNNILTVCLQDL
jgi:hypothetical protein